MARAHHLGLVLTLTLLVSVIVTLRYAFGVPVDLFYPKPAVGVASMTMGVVLLAAVLPSLRVGVMVLPERLAAPGRRPVLWLAAFGVLMLPLLVLVPWWMRLRAHLAAEDPHLLGRITSTHGPWQLAGSLLLVCLLGGVSVSLLGRILGPILTLSFWAGSVVAMNYFGPEVFFGALHSGNRWQTNWVVVAAAFVITSIVIWSNRGSLSLRLTRREM